MGNCNSRREPLLGLVFFQVFNPFPCTTCFMLPTTMGLSPRLKDFYLGPFFFSSSHVPLPGGFHLLIEFYFLCLWFFSTRREEQLMMKPWQTSLNKAPRKGRKKKKELIWREQLMWSPSDKDALGFAVASHATLLAYLYKQKVLSTTAQKLIFWFVGLALNPKP